jgi:hypothetical protein
MRAHVLSKLSDDQIRTLHAEAVQQYQRMLQYTQDQKAAAQKARADQIRVCGDIAYKTRHEQECSRAVMGNPMADSDRPPSGYSSPEAIFERNVLGLCEFAKTTKEARKLGCLP